MPNDPLNLVQFAMTDSRLALILFSPNIIKINSQRFFDPFQFCFQDARTNVVKLPRLVLTLLPQLTPEQRSYIANMLGIGGGAVLFTWWQVLIPLSKDMPDYGIITKTVIMLLASIMLVSAVYLQEREWYG